MEVFFLLFSQEKRGSFHSPLSSFPQTAVSASRFSQLPYNKKHLSKPTLSSCVQCQLSEQNKQLFSRALWAVHAESGPSSLF